MTVIKIAYRFSSIIGIECYAKNITQEKFHCPAEKSESRVFTSKILCKTPGH